MYISAQFLHIINSGSLAVASVGPKGRDTTKENTITDVGDDFKRICESIVGIIRLVDDGCVERTSLAAHKCVS